jgi:hypothetical protein
MACTKESYSAALWKTSSRRLPRFGVVKNQVSEMQARVLRGILEAYPAARRTEIFATSPFLSVRAIVREEVRGVRSQRQGIIPRGIDRVAKSQWVRTSRAPNRLTILVAWNVSKPEPLLRLDPPADALPSFGNGNNGGRTIRTKSPIKQIRPKIRN